MELNEIPFYFIHYCDWNGTKRIQKRYIDMEWDPMVQRKLLWNDTQ
jgi:hypothetical protein